MKLPLKAGLVEGPPVGLVESALRKFLRKEMSVSQLYTRGSRQVGAWLGLTDEEVSALVANSLAWSARVGPPDDRLRVRLTIAGIRARDAIAARDGRTTRRLS